MGLRTRYKKEIDEAATKWRLDALLVEAVVVQESGGNTDAFRFEPDYWNRYLKGNPKYRSLNPRRVSSSYGLMQVMYSRVLEDKIADNDVWAPELLFIPENGLDVGCGLLTELFAWANTLIQPSDLFARESSLRTLCALAATMVDAAGTTPRRTGRCGTANTRQRCSPSGHFSSRNTKYRSLAWGLHHWLV